MAWKRVPRPPNNTQSEKRVKMRIHVSIALRNVELRDMFEKRGGENSPSRDYSFQKKKTAWYATICFSEDAQEEHAKQANYCRSKQEEEEEEEKPKQS